MLGYLDLLDRNDVAVRFHGGLPQRAVTGIQGLPGFGLPGARLVVVPRPTAHGAINRSRFMQEKVATIEGWVQGATQEATQSEFDVLMRAVYDCLDTPRELRWQRGTTGTQLFALVRMSEGDISTSVETAKLMRYQVNLRLDDPRAYSQTQSVATSATLGAVGGGMNFPSTFPLTLTPGAAGSVFVNVGGIVSTPATFRIYGDITNPSITLLPSGPSINLTGTIGPAEYVDVDVFNREVRDVNGAVVNYLVNWATTSWFELPESSSVQLTAASAGGGAYMTVTYRDAYA